jgi:hypothetical protein
MLRPVSSLVGSALLALPITGHAVSFELHGKAWADAGRIMHATDTLEFDMNGNSQQSVGVQIAGHVDLGANLSGAFGIGTFQVYHSLGNADQEKFALTKFVNYVSEASLTYSVGDKENPTFSATVGDFAYNYAPHVKNLGLYLFRGPVYPGFLVSGFKDFHTDTSRASFLGFQLHHAWGDFQHDILMSSEREFAPSFDWSLGYVARYKVLKALEIGACVNFYHLISETEDLTSPNAGVDGILRTDSSLIHGGAPYSRYQLQYMEAMGPGDTVFYTHRGTKLMAMFNLDIKEMLGLDAPFGEKDLLLYGEAALIGVKNYGSIYSKVRERIPLMAGFHLPTFGLLDFLSLEVEYYPAKYKADYSKLGYYNSLYFKNINPTILKTQRAPSAVPISLKDYAGEKYTITETGDFVAIATGDTIQVRGTDLDVENMTADDWKWSINAEKTVLGHIQFSGQIANDHFVPRPLRGGVLFEEAGLSQVLSSTKDWYFMFRVGYFF